MPQANILIVGFPITISVGMLILVSTVPLFAVVFKKLLLVFETRITEIIVGF
jgi:flagellar biosynthesis protein FliR